MRDPFPFLEQIIKVYPPGQFLPDDLDTPQGYRSGRFPDPLAGDISLTVHHGGGPNPAGDPLDEPESPWWQKLAVSFGRVTGVLRSWHAYHRSKGWQAIAYCAAIDPRMGRVYRLRGYRRNAGQWGGINAETMATVFVLGYPQYPTRAAWRALGLIWLAMTGPEVKGHRDWNDDPRTQSPTSCPGPDIWQGLHAGRHVEALGRLRYRTVPMRGVAVRAATLRLTELGYLARKQRRYLRNVANAVEQFQSAHGLVVDGIVGPVTWKALAKG